MSRIGKQPVPVPAGVDVTIEGQSVSVKGPKGTLSLTVAEPITVARNDDGAIVVTRPDDERRNRSLHGLSRTLIAEAVWEMNFDSDTNVVDVNVRRLRAKVDEPFPLKLIHTVRGAGYVLESQA